MSTIIMEHNNLRKSFHERIILDISHIEFEYDKSYAIVGENGAGKSTLLKILAGILDSECKDSNNIGKKKLVISYMPQKPYIFEMSVMENMIRTAKGKTKHDLEHILEQLHIKNLKNNQATMLSGGEKQRLAFARILSRSCDVLLLDEPSSAMDVKGVIVFEKVLKEYQKQNNCTLIMTTHDIAQAKRIADKIIYMKDGKIVMQGDYKT